jgi:hypothetical protein
MEQNMNGILEMLRAINIATDTKALDTLEQACRDRRKVLTQETIIELEIQPGDKIKFSNIIRPRYLAGLSAEVVTTNSTTVTVKIPMDPRYGKFSGRSYVRVPFALIGGKA